VQKEKWIHRIHLQPDNRERINYSSNSNKNNQAVSIFARHMALVNQYEIYLIINSTSLMKIKSWNLSSHLKEIFSWQATLKNFSIKAWSSSINLILIHSAKQQSFRAKMALLFLISQKIKWSNSGRRQMQIIYISSLTRSNLTGNGKDPKMQLFSSRWRQNVLSKASWEIVS
jgi:hypothetical protein